MTTPLRTLPALLAMVLLLAAVPCAAQDPAGVAEGLRRALVYPAPARLHLPPALPALDAEPALNQAHLALASALADMGLLALKPTTMGMGLHPTDAAYGLAMLDMDLNYAPRALLLTMGEWDIEVTSVQPGDERITAMGRRVLVRPTAILEPVLRLLPASETGHIEARATRWVIPLTPSGPAYDQAREEIPGAP